MLLSLSSVMLSPGPRRAILPLLVLAVRLQGVDPSVAGRLLAARAPPPHGAASWRGGASCRGGRSPRSPLAVGTFAALAVAAFGPFAAFGPGLQAVSSCGGGGAASVATADWGAASGAASEGVSAGRFSCAAASAVWR